MACGYGFRQRDEEAVEASLLSNRQPIETIRQELERRHAPFLAELRRRARRQACRSADLRMSAVRFLFDEDCKGRIVRSKFHSNDKNSSTVSPAFRIRARSVPTESSLCWGIERLTRTFAFIITT